jgi:hypothetical protein
MKNGGYITWKQSVNEEQVILLAYHLFDGKHVTVLKPFHSVQQQ